ncbi:cell division protein FtsA [Vulcanibacillus modesticaldus]|uniref:Cell division protein FtsA n=1 Tax=Vulcanibacillus modesticaldus TaxID=337097 RepID=A0A1D2YUZ8_9BACI|nr:cell division protein FtsA [Vulcanibacillus modesticaldus]OEF99530.1 cell division protein FtsA [Vulcanibacillus modesticaldus]
MNSNDVIVGLDIGTSKVRVIIGEISNGSLNIIGVGSSDSEGIKKGAIVDIEQTVQSIRNAIDHAERMVGITIDEVYVGISGNHIDLQSSHGVVAVSSEDKEISDADIDRVIQASKVIALPPDREIIDVVPKEFIVDGLAGIKVPKGMIGVRLEVSSTIITGSKTIIHNLIRTIEKSDLRIAGFILMPLAASQIALSKDEMNLGVVLVDIGEGATTISVFEHGGLVKTTVIPIGGEYITNDISIGLRTQMDIAEQVKLKYGIANFNEANEDIKFKVPRIGSNVDKEYTQIDLAHIVEPRVREIFQIIREEVYKLGFTKEIPGGYVLTGGVVSMKGMLSVAQEELLPAARIAIPDYIGVRDPSFINGVGIVEYASNIFFKPNNLQKRALSSNSKSRNSSPFERVKNWFSEFI